VLILPSNQVPVVEALIPAIEAALNDVQPRAFVEISMPSQ
jgi:hypothetical protein